MVFQLNMAVDLQRCDLLISCWGSSLLKPALVFHMLHTLDTGETIAALTFCHK